MRAPRPTSAVVVGFLFALVIASASCSAEAPAKATNKAPATLVEAEAVLDLAIFPLPEGAKVLGFRRLAALSYTVNKPIKEVLDFNAQALTKRGWKEVKGSRREEGPFSRADYTHGDFYLNLSLIRTNPTGPVTVRFSRYGNVTLTNLPTPKGVKQLYAFPATVAYTTDGTVKETAKLCQKIMVTAGWTPYGSAGTTAYYRQNAVLVKINVASAPAQAGQTAITFTSELLSLELPAFPNAIGFRYDDTLTEMSFDTDSSPIEVANFYRKAFEADGWRVTTDEPVTIDSKQLTIFRKPGQEMITITTHEFEGRRRVRVDHQTAAEVAEEELLAKEGGAKRATYRKGKKPEVVVVPPDNVEVQQDKPYSLRLRVKRGTAFAVCDAVAEALIADGWSGEPFAKVPVFGARLLKKGEAQVWVLATEPPKVDPWVAVVGVGATLKSVDR